MSVDDQIAKRREYRKTIETLIKLRGQELYDTYTDDERTLVQFGMQPAEKIQPATDNLILELTDNGQSEIGGGLDIGDVSRLLCVAVMDAANRGNKKMVV